jgi:hypothetical protein
VNQRRHHDHPTPIAQITCRLKYGYAGLNVRHSDTPNSSEEYEPAPGGEEKGELLRLFREPYKRGGEAGQKDEDRRTEVRDPG